MSLLVLLSRGLPHTITVGQPGAQGAGTTGTQGMGVSAPRAAAVADAYGFPVASVPPEVEEELAKEEGR